MSDFFTPEEKQDLHDACFRIVQDLAKSNAPVVVLTGSTARLFMPLLTRIWAQHYSDKPFPRIAALGTTSARFKHVENKAILTIEDFDYPLFF